MSLKKLKVRSQKPEVRRRRQEKLPSTRFGPSQPPRRGRCRAEIKIFAFGLAACLIAIFTLANAPVAAVQQSQPLLATADQVFQEMSRITGLPIRAALKRELVSRPQVEKFMTGKIREDYPPEEMHVQEATLKAFGFVSSEFNLEKFLVAFYTEQAAGFYEPDQKTMYIADWPPPELQALVMAHELTHALQDQNFDLKKFLEAEKKNDATAARQAVAEGHAMAAMIQKMVGPADLGTLPSLEPMMSGLAAAQMQQYPVFSSAPYFFRFQALFPYTEGMGFMQKGLGLGGWKKLNSVFLHPPETTKEFFENSVYFNSESLPKISLPRPPAFESAPGYKRLSENTLGELGYRALLGQFISEQEAKSAGSQWLADRYILYERSSPHAYALVARSRWASSEAALEVFRSCHTILAQKYPELTAERSSAADLFAGSSANGRVVLMRRGSECLWAEGVPAKQAETMVKWLESLAQ